MVQAGWVVKAGEGETLGVAYTYPPGSILAITRDARGIELSREYPTTLPAGRQSRGGDLGSIGNVEYSYVRDSTGWPLAWGPNPALMPAVPVYGPPEPPPPPAVFQIPGWLRSWLLLLNWDIFAWQIHVGDALLTAIQWVVDGLNQVYEWGQRGAAAAQDAWSHAGELFQTAQTNLNAWTSYLYNLITAWPGQLSEWWWATRTDVLDWIDSAVQNTLAGVQGFLSFDWFTAWWGNTTTSFADWWEARRLAVLEWIDVSVAPVRNQVNRLTEVSDLLTSPGDTALRWLWDRITTAIVRLW